MNHREITSHRFFILVRCLDHREDVTLGILAHLWLRCIHDRCDTFPTRDAMRYIICPYKDTDAVIEGLLVAGYITQVGDAYEVKDVVPWIARAHIRHERASKAGKKSAKVRAKKRAALRKLEKAETQIALPQEHEAQVAARNCWAAYADAYETLFHVKPVRNVKINSLIKQLCKRIPMDDAPLVLRFYVGHGNSFYAQRMYPLDLAVKDAESLHTQWKLNKPITKATIEKFNQREKMRDALEDGVIF